MQPSEKKAFLTLMADVYAFHRQPFSKFTGETWWRAMQPFDYAAVNDAFIRQTMNPDSGQYLPKPADIVRMLGGTTIDRAATAWTEVDFGVRTVGPWKSVVFDDPIIHRVIADMGGWVKLCGTSADDYPFVAKDMQTRYRGFVMQPLGSNYPAVLVGLAESQNALAGFLSQQPVAIGDPEKCRLVFRNGSERPRIQSGPMLISQADKPKRLK